MNLRFPTNLAHLVLGGALLTVCFAFSLGTVGWLALGAGCVAVVVSMAGFTLTARGGAQRTLDVLMASLGGWLIVASRVLPAGGVKWVTFGVAAAFAALAAVGLVRHERMRERLLNEVSERPPVQASLIDGRWRSREARPESQPITAAPGVGAQAR